MVFLSKGYKSPVAVEEDIKPSRYAVVIQCEPDRELWRVGRGGIQNRDVSQKLENQPQLRIKRIQIFCFFMVHGSFANSIKISLILASSWLSRATSAASS